MTEKEYQIIDAVMEDHGIITGMRNHIMADIRSKMDEEKKMIQPVKRDPGKDHSTWLEQLVAKVEIAIRNKESDSK